MMRKHFKAFSMVEVIVSAIILVTTVSLVFGTIANTRQPLMQSSRRLQAAMYGQEVLDSLRSKVSYTEWTNATGLLAAGTYDLNAVLANPSQVNGTYTVVDQVGVRKVTASVTYNNSL